MLDPEQQVEIPDVHGCSVYGDDRLVGGFYVVPKHPRVAISDNEQPELQLTVYGQRKPSGFEPTGALLTLTTELAVPTDVMEAVVDLLRKHIVETWPKDSDATPPLPTMLAVDWIDATVEVQFTDEITFAGTPSLSGPNRCSFSANIDATQARALGEAWSRRLPNGRISYEGHLRTRPATTSTTVGSSSGSITIETDDGVEAVRWEGAHVNTTGHRGVHEAANSPFVVSATSSLADSVPKLASAVSNVELG